MPLQQRLFDMAQEDPDRCRVVIIDALKKSAMRPTYAAELLKVSYNTFMKILAQMNLEEAINDAYVDWLKKALKASGMNRYLAAKRMGISYPTFFRWVIKYKLEDWIAAQTMLAKQQGWFDSGKRKPKRKPPPEQRVVGGIITKM